MSTLLITGCNIIFWLALHFGVAGVITSLPLSCQNRLFDYRRASFRVSEREMACYKKLRIARWKDLLPQYNRDFDKRHLRLPCDSPYLAEFIFNTCRAETIHILIGIAGFASLLFCLLEERPLDYLPWYILIALLVLLANLPFALIQRYNRQRLLRVYHLLKSREDKEQPLEDGSC